MTEKFRAQADSVARFVGLPDLPRVVLPHPVAGRPRDEMDALAASVVDAVLDGLRG